MNIQAEKLKLIEQLLKTESSEIIDKIKTIFQRAEEGDFWNELTEEQKTEINDSISEIESGEVVDYKSVTAKFR